MDNQFIKKSYNNFIVTVYSLTAQNINREMLPI